MNIYEKLMNIQTELKVPKSQFNSFGKYKFRNLEDILEGLKPLLFKYKLVLNIVDDLVQIGDRYYVVAVAEIINIEEPKEFIHSKAYAREDEIKKGMDLSQLSGSTSSYARKYALNGLFAIDDTKDSDTTNNGATPPKQKKQGAGGTVTLAQLEKNEKKIPAEQINQIYEVANEKDISKDKVRSHVLKRFKKEIELLTKEEYLTVYGGYKNMENKK